jgi:hypothetical protein
MTLFRAHPFDERPESQEPEGISTKRVIAIAIVFLIIFTLATIWAVSIWRRDERRIPKQEAVPADVGKPQVGMVNQRLFELQLEAQRKREEQLQRLNSYGWVDSERQIIHIPVRRAMEKMAEDWQP